MAYRLAVIIMKEISQPTHTFLELTERVNKELLYYEELCAKADHFTRKITGLDNHSEPAIKHPNADTLISILEIIIAKMTILNSSLSASLDNIEKVVNI